MVDGTCLSRPYVIIFNSSFRYDLCSHLCTKHRCTIINQMKGRPSARPCTSGAANGRPKLVFASYSYRRSWPVHQIKMIHGWKEPKGGKNTGNVLLFSNLMEFKWGINFRAARRPAVLSPVENWLFNNSSVQHYLPLFLCQLQKRRKSHLPVPSAIFFNNSYNKLQILNGEHD